MADLGFLPAVRRILEQTPRGGQRMLFSATLDSGVNVLVKRFLDNPATHEADSAQSPISTMDHHVLHVHRDHRVPVLVDLASAPGRTVVFTRTKHGAKNAGPPAELARRARRSSCTATSRRTRAPATWRRSTPGKATTLVATDIAARGIHVDDVALVVHADPPAEHKAYLHRSGRTARAGAAGTVITLMTDQQVKDVRDLTRAAKISPTTTKISGPEPRRCCAQLAPGERVLVAGGLKDDRPEPGPQPVRRRWRWRRSSSQRWSWPGLRPVARASRVGRAVARGSAAAAPPLHRRAAGTVPRRSAAAVAAAEPSSLSSPAASGVGGLARPRSGARSRATPGDDVADVVHACAGTR